jgi:hypothetical protein
MTNDQRNLRQIIETYARVSYEAGVMNYSGTLDQQETANAKVLVAMADLRTALDPAHVARQFHEAYERLAPSVGYTTREDTRTFNPTTANGKLMIAVCAELVSNHG